MANQVRSVFIYIATLEYLNLIQVCHHLILRCLWQGVNLLCSSAFTPRLCHFTPPSPRPPALHNSLMSTAMEINALLRWGDRMLSSETLFLVGKIKEILLMKKSSLFLARFLTLLFFGREKASYLWTIPWQCRYPTADRICLVYLLTSLSASLCLSQILSRRSPPRHSSITM